MTKEEKNKRELLLRDFCARVPYRVMALVENVFLEPEDVEIEAVTAHQEAKLDGYNFTVDIHDLKPYLRSGSSMTEEEVKEFVSLDKTLFCTLAPGMFREIANPEQIDWLNAHHIDYRGLIPMGLAIEAPDGMYLN